MKWLLVLLSDDNLMLDKSPHIDHESEDQAKTDLLGQFDYLFNEYMEGEYEDDSKS